MSEFNAQRIYLAIYTLTFTPVVLISGESFSMQDAITALALYPVVLKAIRGK